MTSTQGQGTGARLEVARYYKFHVASVKPGQGHQKR